VGRILAGVVVLTLLSTAVLAVRGAMQERRERAEQAFRAALACALRPSLGRTEELRQCSQAARVAGVTPAAVSILLVHLKKSNRAA